MRRITGQGKQMIMERRAVVLSSALISSFFGISVAGHASAAQSPDAKPGKSPDAKLPQSPSRIVEGELRSALLPHSMKYGVLLPPGYDESGLRYPVVFPLYPGPPESYLAIRRWRKHIELAWAEGRLPPAIVITPAIDMSMYSAPQAGGLAWEEAFVGPFLDQLKAEYRLWTDRPAFYATGLSAGGAVTARLGLKHPELFGGIAALAPGIEAVGSIDRLTFEDTFWRPQNTYNKVDPKKWAAQQPLNIAKSNAARIRNSGMKIYLESGGQDSFLLYRGTEALHRILSDEGIQHEYHVRYGVDHHVGTVMIDRWQDVYGFFGTQMRNAPPEPIVADLKSALKDVKLQAAKKIPNDDRLKQSYSKLFTFAAPQTKIDNELLEERLKQAKAR